METQMRVSLSAINTPAHGALLGVTAVCMTGGAGGVDVA